MFFPDTVQNTIGNDTFEFTALTKNARINSNDKVVQILAELEHHSWDIIFFNETRMKSGKKLLDGGHVLYSCLDENCPCAGVAILLHAKHVRKNIKVHMVSLIPL